MSTKENKDRLGDYQFIKTIGEGTFGKVKLSLHLPTKEYVAIKILEKSRIHDKEELERVEKEIKYLKMLNHPNIIQIYEVIENQENFYIVMEYVSGGELFNYIVEHEKLDEKEASFFFSQLIYGIKEIHKNKICHRDMKPENLLLTENKLIKIIDFGLSNEYTDYLTTQCGSPCYAAPEMIRGTKYDGLMIDLWACGIILYAMLCGYLPFDDKDNNILFRKIIQCKLEFPNEKEIYLSPDAKDLISRILVPNPLKRIKIEETLCHPFLTNGIKEYKNIIKPVLFNQEEVIIDYMVNILKYSNEDQMIYKLIKANKHNSCTTTYKLLKKKIMEGRFDYNYYNKERANNAYISPNNNIKMKININNKENINNNNNINNKENINNVTIKRNKHYLRGSLRRSIKEKINENDKIKKTCSLDSTKNSIANDLYTTKDNNKYIKENDIFTLNNNNMFINDLMKKNPLYHKIVSNNREVNNFNKQIDTSVSVEKKQINKKKKIKIISKTPPKFSYKYITNNPFTYEYDTYNKKKIIYFPNHLINYNRKELSEDKTLTKRTKIIQKPPPNYIIEIKNANLKDEKKRNVYRLNPVTISKDIVKNGLSADKVNKKITKLKKNNIKNHTYIITKIENNDTQRSNRKESKEINSELSTNISVYSPCNTPSTIDRKNYTKKLTNNRNIVITSYKNKEMAKTPINKRKKTIFYINNNNEQKKIPIIKYNNNYNTIQTNKYRNYMNKDNNNINDTNKINNNTLNTNIIYNNYIYHQNNINNIIRSEKNTKCKLNKDKAKIRTKINNNNANYYPLIYREKINERENISNYHERTKKINNTNENIYYDNKKNNSILNKNINNKTIIIEKSKINAFLITNTNLSIKQIKKALNDFCNKYNFKYYDYKENKYMILINNTNSFILEVNLEPNSRILKFYHNKGSDEITKKNMNKLWFEMNPNMYS